jgi:hypothetical protein
MRNHEYYIDRTAGETIRRMCDIAHSRKKQRKPWGDQLTYRIREVMD